MAYAIIRTGGKQYRVIEGERIRLEKLTAEVGEEVKFEDVLMLGEGAGIQSGADALAGKAVSAKVLSHGKGRKIHMWMFKRRKGSQTKKGHRQPFTEVQITSIPTA